jgi:hypothetical protein
LHRFETGSDVAKLVAWDDALADRPLSTSEQGEDLDELLCRAASQAELFLLRPGMDCSVIVDVYVDEELPPQYLELATLVPGRFRLELPSGRLRLTGGEEFRRAGPSQAVPAGSYRLSCYTVDQEQEAPSEARLAELVGAENLAYFDRTTNRAVLLGFLVPVLLFPLLKGWLGWRLSLPFSVVGFFVYFWIAKAVLDRIPLYARLSRVIPEFRRVNDIPTYIFQMQRLGPEDASLRGGWLDLG